jgi:hypothetical protein
MAALCARLEHMDNHASEEELIAEVALLQGEFEAAYRELDNRHLGD